MKKTNTVIIATIIATFVFSIFAFQPTRSEASSNASPLATPKLPRPIQSPITKIKTKKSGRAARDLDGQSAGAEKRAPNGRKIRAVPTSTREPIRKIKAKYPTNYKEGGVNDMTFRRKPRRNGKH